MISKQLDIKIVDTPIEAPNYGPDYTGLKMVKCIIVGKGTKSGKPTVDIQLTDKEGNKYLIMTTGAILESLGGAIMGKRERDEEGL